MPALSFSDYRKIMVQLFCCKEPRRPQQVRMLRIPKLKLSVYPENDIYTLNSANIVRQSKTPLKTSQDTLGCHGTWLGITDLAYVLLD